MNEKKVYTVEDNIKSILFELKDLKKIIQEQHQNALSQEKIDDSNPLPF